ncbi:hypothetical protein [Paraburkholderia sp. RL17-347-BIC-D]|uniref:hypothetical protein n=1 Tax=Paraburkholderia sp. RL17-347-BIC-D TaxID=3031632 RepID=UPI0038BC0990
MPHPAFDQDYVLVMDEHHPLALQGRYRASSVATLERSFSLSAFHRLPSGRSFRRLALRYAREACPSAYKVFAAPSTETYSRCTTMDQKWRYEEVRRFGAGQTPLLKMVRQRQESIINWISDAVNRAQNLRKKHV